MSNAAGAVERLGADEKQKVRAGDVSDCIVRFERDVHNVQSLAFPDCSSNGRDTSTKRTLYATVYQ